MANEQNLIPLNRRSREEAKKIRQKGGIAAQKARRARKTARECAEIYLSLPVADLQKWKRLAREGVEPEDVDNMMLMIAGAVRAAQEGDVSALREVLRIIGEDKAEPEEDGGGVIVLAPREDGESDG